MRVRSTDAVGGVSVELVDESGAPVAVVSAFLRHLAARGCSPNTVAAYAYDLRHLWCFLFAHGLDWREFGPPHALELLEALRATPSRRPAQRLGLTVATHADGQPARWLAPATVNRVLAAVSSFYEYVILAGVWDRANPIEKRPDPALLVVGERHRPFMGRASRQRPVRRAVRVKTPQRVPRPLSDGQVQALLGALRWRTRSRDRVVDVAGRAAAGWGAGPAVGRCRLRPAAGGDPPPRGSPQGRAPEVPSGAGRGSARARGAGRGERVRDECPPARTPTVPLVFLVGGGGSRRLEPLGYDGLVRMFARACVRGGIREPWVTPHALRHTHATRMWEGGMRELSLQKRLGHASPESIRIYTRVSDPEVAADYRRALDTITGRAS